VSKVYRNEPHVWQATVGSSVIWRWTRSRLPCDEYGNVLEEPKIENMPFCSVNGEGYDYAILKYQQAKERCLFEGFEIRKMEGWNILDFPNNQYSQDFSVLETSTLLSIVCLGIPKLY